MTYSGLTWDHPRGYDALAEAARLANSNRTEPLITWEKQPLEGFESAPISDLTAKFDLVVLDHPHVGEAVAKNCLMPLEDLYPPDRIAEWEKNSVGPSLVSYQFQGNTYAIPLDVASQVMVRRPDMLEHKPESWEEILEVALEFPVAQSIAGPHAVLTLISMAGGEGAFPCGEEFLDGDVAIRQLETMHKLHALRPKGSESLNPIELLNKMQNTTDIALIPLVFGYVTYSVPNSNGCRLEFSDSIRTPSGFGGVLGGTGIGFSQGFTPNEDLLSHIGWLMEEETQIRMIPDHGGQPSSLQAWRSQEVNEKCGQFYHNTLATAENALLRPRFDGFIRFQSMSSEIIRQYLGSNQKPTTTLNLIREVWKKTRSEAVGNLDDNRRQEH